MYSKNLQLHIFVGRGTTAKREKKLRNNEKPFRIAFGRLGELRSFLPNCPVISLSASIRKQHRERLKRILGMESAVVINMSPNKMNVRMSIQKVSDTPEALSKFNWLISLIKEKQETTPKCIIFCNTLTDIPQILSYLLMKLEDAAFIMNNNKKNWLIAIYHSETWESSKTNISTQFQNPESSNVRVIIATTSLSMGVNFPDVKYIIHFLAPARTLEEHLQQMGRAGRDGNSAYDITIYSNQKIKDCENDVKEVFKSDQCSRKLLLKNFDENIGTMFPGHDCCSNCAKCCSCQETCPNSLPFEDEKTVTSVMSHDLKPRMVSQEDKIDFKKALISEQRKLTSEAGGSTIFGGDTLHGFSDDLISAAIEKLDMLFTPRDLHQYLPIYATKHALVILELLQEFFCDIPNFEEHVNNLWEIEGKAVDVADFLKQQEVSSEMKSQQLCYADDFFSDDDFLPEFELEL